MESDCAATMLPFFVGTIAPYLDAAWLFASLRRKADILCHSRTGDEVDVMIPYGSGIEDAGVSNIDVTLLLGMTPYQERMSGESAFVPLL